MKFKTVIYVLISLIILIFTNDNVYADNLKFISIEPHLGFGNANEFYIGGKIYNYRGPIWTRDPYYNKPNLILQFNNEIIKINPDSEGYFEACIPIKNDRHLNYGYQTLNQTLVSLDKYQNRKNKDLVLVNNYGLNANGIYLPFIIPDKNLKFGIISDIDNTITVSQGLGFKELITTDPKDYKIREGIVDVLNKLSNNINPVFYVTARPNGTYKVIETLLDDNKFPVGPIMARNLGFWFINRGRSIKEHKLKSIESIMNLLSGTRFVLIGDNSQYDPEVYLNIQKKYPNRVIKIFIFKMKHRKILKNTDIIYIDTPEEITSEISRLGLI